MKINIKQINEGKLPEYKTSGSVGADCFANINEDLFLFKNQITKVPLGFAVEIPEGYEIQVRGRSGLSKDMIFVITGTIDSDYRGEVSAVLYNASGRMFKIKRYDRIAQIILSPIIKADWNQVQELSSTERGENGFGSTGVSEKEDFYEPFQTFQECENMVGVEVLLDDKNIMKIEAIENNFLNRPVFILSFNGTKCEQRLNTVQMFERAKIDGHRFGRVIK